MTTDDNTTGGLPKEVAQCPNCGYCQHCGRSNQPWSVPWYPNYYPTYPFYTTSGNAWDITPTTTVTGTG